MINYSIDIRAVNSNLLEINQAKARIKAAKEAGENSTKANSPTLFEDDWMPICGCSFP